MPCDIVIIHLRLVQQWLRECICPSASRPIVALRDKCVKMLVFMNFRQRRLHACSVQFALLALFAVLVTCCQLLILKAFLASTFVPEGAGSRSTFLRAMAPKVKGVTTHQGPEIVQRGMPFKLDQLSTAEASGHRVPMKGTSVV